MSKRLIKIAKELNVGTSTIVEHLVANGFDIENKPTAKVTDEMYSELTKEFQKSIAIKEKADSLVIGTRPAAPATPTPTPVKKEREKVTISLTPSPAKETPATPPPPPPVEEKPEPVVARVKLTPEPEPTPEPKKEEPVVEKPVVEEPKPTPIVKTPEPEPPVVKQPEQPKPVKAKEPEITSNAPKLKILGKIDLKAHAKGKPVKKPTEPKKPVAETPKVEAKKEVKQEAPKRVVKLEQPTAKSEPIKKKQEVKAERPVVENKGMPKATPVQNKKPLESKGTPKQEKPTTPIKENKPTPVAKTEDKKASNDTPTPAKPTEEGTPPAKGDKVIRADAPELRGLKIVGKIDTDKFKRKRKKKDDPKKTGDKPGASTDKKDGDSTRRRRRKRKTISTTNFNQPQGQRGGGQGGSGSRSSGGQGQGRGGSGSSGGQGQRGGQGGNNSGGNRGGSNRSGGNRPGGNRRGGRNDRNTGRGRRDEVKEVSQKEIEDKIKATMERLSGRGKKKRQKIRRDNRSRLREKQEQREQEAQTDTLQVTEFISVSELASLMGVGVTDVIMTCMNLGVIVSINQRLDAEIIELVAEEFNHEVEFISAEEQMDEEEEIVDDPKDLQPRAPIVTVMGHVDHGKTSLLDYIRNASVADGEAGGITQHIGAYEVRVGEEDKRITFLDTPGHEAFTAMRARGAKVTDIAIIIIAADDSIMPQTKEAISHAQAAGVPMIFAINKIDKDGANPERIKQELASMNILVESWGGKYQSQDISAKTGENIDELLEKVVLEAEILELKANPDREAIGTVLEASLDKGRGYVTKMLVQTGTLKIGDPTVAGEHSGKVKAMFNEHGKRIKEAGPSKPVLVLGLSGAPQAGERIKVLETEQEARSIASKRAQIAREQANRATKRISLDEIGRRLALGTFKELNLIVKGDVDGSVEALSDSLIKQSIETVQVNVIHKAVGQIIESDVLLASASDAIIVGFQVRPSLGARKLAEREGVEIKTYSIIYEAIDEIRTAIEGLLEPTKEEKITSTVDVREVYKISKVGTIAGCYVQEGKISRNSLIRVIRNGIVVYPVKEGAVGEIASLKRFKDDAKEVKSGLECGISIKNFNDLKVDDVIESYEIIEVKQTLD